MASKYLKNSEGIVRAITSDNLQLEKPLLNENYDIEVHNRNMDKIDSAIQEVKGIKNSGLAWTVSILLRRQAFWDWYWNCSGRKKSF